MLSFGGAASRYAGFCLVTPRNLIELSKEEGGWQPTTLCGSSLVQSVNGRFLNAAAVQDKC